MLSLLQNQIAELLAESVRGFFPDGVEMPVAQLDTPMDKAHGEFSCNLAMQSARALKKPPVVIAKEFVAAMEARLADHPLRAKIRSIEVKNPGFINFFLTEKAFFDILEQVFQERDEYGRTNYGRGERVQLEFVSANPTGPLSVAHARQAAVGDCLGNIMAFSGFEVTKEYYVNDEGNQINILGRSIRFRAQEILGEKVEFPEECYQGDYIRDMARAFLEKNRVTDSAGINALPAVKFSQFGVDYLLAVIRQELLDFGVKFDTWSHQSEVASPERTGEVLAELREQGFVYEKEGALWFESTRFGDDKDRVVRKSDGSYTYFAPDIAYHRDKFRRGFQKVFNIWGPDHHGYIPRLTAAVQALGRPREALRVLIVQLATIYRQGKPVSMSTRRGQYISLQEVMDEVGVDAARFFFLMRSISAHLDFDLELAKQETAENPVYYIQYAHARINSIIARAGDSGLRARAAGFSLLKEEEELALIKKVGSFPDILNMCCGQMDVFALINYLMELATCFHKFYDRLRVVDPGNKDLSEERLGLIDTARIVLANGLRLVGVSAPERM